MLSREWHSFEVCSGKTTPIAAYRHSAGVRDSFVHRLLFGARSHPGPIPPALAVSSRHDGRARRAYLDSAGRISHGDHAGRSAAFRDSRSAGWLA